MSSEIYELMKRSDEADVVERAHRNPRFVEDVVREMIRQVADRYPQLREGGFVLARQENLETIHRHSVVAERSGELPRSSPSSRPASTPRGTSPSASGLRLRARGRRRSLVRLFEALAQPEEVVGA